MKRGVCVAAIYFLFLLAFETGADTERCNPMGTVLNEWLKEKDSNSDYKRE